MSRVRIPRTVCHLCHPVVSLLFHLVSTKTKCLVNLVNERTKKSQTKSKYKTDLNNGYNSDNFRDEQVFIFNYICDVGDVRFGFRSAQSNQQIVSNKLMNCTRLLLTATDFLKAFIPLFDACMQSHLWLMMLYFDFALFICFDLCTTRFQSRDPIEGENRLQTVFVCSLLTASRA